jgi:hypothetical protein
MANTPHGLWYPSDYNDPADVPSALEQSMLAVEAALDVVDAATAQAQATASAVQGRTLSAGAGLTGGGTLSASRTFDVIGGTGITVTADAVSVDTGTIATRAYADGKVANSATGGSTTVAPSQASIKAYVDGRIWMGTQSAYDAIGTKDPTVLYVITG